MEIKTSEQIDQLSKAMLAAQKEIDHATIDAANPHFRSRYATLNSVIDACKGPLNSAGIFFVQAPVALDCKDCLGLATRLTHAESGQWLEATMHMPLQKVDPQGMGSAITYARRYALMAILGMAAEDDDAEAAQGRPPQQSYQASQPAPKQEPRPRQAAMAGQLPVIDGVQYAEDYMDGRPVYVAMGKVFPHKEKLKAAGFRYHADSKRWYLPSGQQSVPPRQEEPPVPEYEDSVPF